MKVAWYIYSDQGVVGPFSTEKILEGFENHTWSAETLIWRKGQREWISLKLWQQDLPMILEIIQAQVEKTVWYVETKGLQQGPMHTKELQNFISANDILTTCKVWTTGMHKWSSVFELPELLSAMQITCRKYPRAPIKGNVLLRGNSRELSMPLDFIGQGGLSTKNSQNLSEGEHFDIVINSPMLITPIHAKAVVVSAKNGTAGFQFVHLQPEPQSTIVSFVKQFQI